MKENKTHDPGPKHSKHKPNKLMIWKTITIILGILLILSIYTDGFKDIKTKIKTLTKGDATGIDESGRAFKGAADAKIVITEYSSFSCGYCGRARGTIDQIIEAYPEDVKIIYKHFNRGGTDSQTAQAAECAGEQGEFWGMHDLIFDQGASDLSEYAKTLGLNVKEFDKCMSTEKYVLRVNDDTTEARTAGVQGTPTFYINGQQLVGAQPLSAFKAIIDAELAK